MGKRDKYVPESFLRVLRKNIDGFKDMSRQHQWHMAYYVYHAGTTARAHRLWEGYSSFTWQELERDFGRGGFQRINRQLQIFEISRNWRKDKAATKGYKLMSSVQAAVDGYFRPRRRSLTKLICADGLYLRSLPKPIDSKDSDGITASAWRDAKPLNSIPVDTTLLRVLHRHIDRGQIKTDSQDLFHQATQEDLEFIRRQIEHLLDMARTDIAGRDHIVHRYVEARSGRLYAKGVSLQTVPRLVRHAALHGLYDYDFENCHYAIFQQLAARYGYECTAIMHYLDNKKAVRSEIARSVGITENHAKTCLLAIMYGARRNEWHENAIPMTVGKSGAKSLYRNDLFNGIADDIQQGRAAILKGWPKRRTTLLNVMDKRISLKEPPERRLAHIIQGIEAKALRKAVSLYPDDIVLLMHDGFVCDCSVDARLIEREVYNDTGYRLAISGSVITIPADLEFSKT